MTESETRKWLAMREELEDRAIDIVENMRVRKRNKPIESISQHEPTIDWPEDDEDNVSVSWTEYGAHGSVWYEGESFPLRWIWDDEWYEKFTVQHESREQIKAVKEQQRAEEKEKREVKQRRAQYLKLKEEFNDE